MFCSKCGKQLEDSSAFCMNCGAKINLKSKELDNLNIDNGLSKNKNDKLDFEANLKPKKRVTSFMIAAIIGLVILIMIICIYLISIYEKSQKSPIEGISQKIYLQGLEYLEAMESPSVRNITIEYIKKNDVSDLETIYDKIDGADFNIDLGNNPTTEEIYFSNLISKFWKSWIICYGQESIISEYEINSNSKVQMLVYMYEGIISNFKKSISEAKYTLTSANDYTDMVEVYEILENMCDGVDKQ